MSSMKTRRRRPPWSFTVTDKTKVLRGDTHVSFADAHIQKDERVAVIVDPDESGSEALEIRLAARDPA